MRPAGSTPLKQKTDIMSAWRTGRMPVFRTAVKAGKGDGEKNLRATSRSQNIPAVRLIRQRDAEPDFNFLVRLAKEPRNPSVRLGPRKTSSQKKNESGANGSAVSSPLKQEDLKCKKTVRYFGRFSPRRFATPGIHRRHLRRNQSRSCHRNAPTFRWSNPCQH